MKTIIFQGDSITDCGRNTNNGSMLSIGQGYALIATAEIMARHPGEYQCFNYGVSGNRIVDIYARIKGEGWNAEPDIISLLIGINDVWHELDWRNGVNPRRFRNMYRTLISDTQIESPKTKMIILEPFILKGSATESKWDDFISLSLENAKIARETAEEFGQVFVPLQDVFNKACEKAPADFWLADGVHPTPAGHRLIADEWLKAFEKNFL